MQIIQAQSRFGRSVLPQELREADPRLTMLGAAWRRLQQQLLLLLNDQSVHAIHDARAQSRSLRALLRVLRDEAHPGRYAQLRFDLINIGRHLAETRTADAHLKLMRELSAATKHLNTKDMLTMIALSERCATAARKALVQRLREPSWSQRVARIAAAIEDSELLLRPKRPVRDECRAAMADVLRTAARELRTGASDSDSLHRQRIRLKNTRYVCEQLQALAQVEGERRTRNTVRDVAHAQETIGEARDLQHLAKWVRKTPIPQALRRPLLERIDKRESKLIAQFARKQKDLRRTLRDSARALEVSE